MPPKRRRTGGGRSSSRRSMNVIKSTETDDDQLMPDADVAPEEDTNVDISAVDAALPADNEVSEDISTEAPALDIDNDDETGADGTTAGATPIDDAEPQDDENDDEEEEEEEQVRPRSVARRRRGGGRGRPSRGGFDSPNADNDDSEAGAPVRRRGGWRGGFRGRPKYGPKSQPDRVAIDKEGTMMDVADDEVALPEDAEGETKVDKMGKLADGRRYRVRVFTVDGKGERLYMLSTEPARCTGFRDSYLFFARHLTLYKVVLTDDQKRDLIDRNLMPNSYKGRSIAVVTARSVFREFGARIIVGGRRITDDYYVQAARDKGFTEGELADPNDRIPQPGETYNRNQYVAWHGASQVYHTTNPSAPVASGRPTQSKRRLHVTTTNWQYEHARQASKFNSNLALIRKANVDGIYDIHTNLILAQTSTQPTHAKWTRALENNSMSNGYTKTLGHTDSDTGNGDTVPVSTSFSSLPPAVSRNFLVTDTVFSSPGISSTSVPGSDIDGIPPDGLSGISDDLIAELPAECKRALLAARRLETEWKSQWGSEASDGLRCPLRIGVNGFPV